jgi:hypothetical protein
MPPDAAFDFSTRAVSIRAGGDIPREELHAGLRAGPMCVEDPFERDHNLTSDMTALRLELVEETP